jgi:DNA-binding NarL/FixJ family response regulator
MNLLIIDPDSGMHEFYSELLLSRFPNLYITYSPSAASALHAYEDGAFDLVLTESRLPDMDILSLLGKLMLKGCPVIVISSIVSERLIVETLRAGAIDFVSKSSLKIDILVPVVKRALIEGDRWSQTLQFASGIPRRPEYEAADKTMRDFLNLERFEARRQQLARGVMRNSLASLHDGEICQIVYLYIKLNFPTALLQHNEKDFIDRTIDRSMHICVATPERYGGSLWIRKDDAVIFAFPEEGILPAVLSAMEIYSSIAIFNRSMSRHMDQICVVSGVTTGQTIYRTNRESIYSEALNMSAHLATKKETGESEIWITGEVEEGIGVRAKRYFQYDGPFEGAQVYRYSLNPPVVKKS